MVRPHNEDRLCAISDVELTASKEGQILTAKWILFAVADGMGGTNAGEVAAEIAIDTVRKSTEKVESLLLRPSYIGKGLEDIIYKAHLNIKSAINEENTGMGTTLVLALLSGHTVHVAWCGDSRVYQYSNEPSERKNSFDLPHLRILTHDHSVVWQMVKKGQLDRNAAREHELSNIITQSLGDPGSDPKPESAVYTVNGGDRILVCSDGLNSMLPDEYIEEILSHDDPLDIIGTSLIEAANANGGQDNISVILAQLENVPERKTVKDPIAKERPEAITAKSDLTALPSGKPFFLQNLLMDIRVLKGILFITILILLCVIYSTYKEGDIQYLYPKPYIDSLPEKDSLTLPGIKDSLIKQGKSEKLLNSDTFSNDLK